MHSTASAELHRSRRFLRQSKRSANAQLLASQAGPGQDIPSLAPSSFSSLASGPHSSGLQPEAPPPGLCFLPSLSEEASGTPQQEDVALPCADMAYLQTDHSLPCVKMPYYLPQIRPVPWSIPHLPSHMASPSWTPYHPFFWESPLVQESSATSENHGANGLPLCGLSSSSSQLSTPQQSRCKRLKPSLFTASSVPLLTPPSTKLPGVQHPPMGTLSAGPQKKRWGGQTASGDRQAQSRHGAPFAGSLLHLCSNEAGPSFDTPHAKRSWAHVSQWAELEPYSAHSPPSTPRLLSDVFVEVLVHQQQQQQQQEKKQQQEQKQQQQFSGRTEGPETDKKEKTKASSSLEAVLSLEELSGDKHNKTGANTTFRLFGYDVKT